MLSSSLIRYYFSRRRTRQDTELSGAAEERLDRSIFSPREVGGSLKEGFVGGPQQLSTSQKSSLSWARLLLSLIHI